METEFNRLLEAWAAGDSAALAELSRQVYDELRRMARHHRSGERRDRTLQTTALVHEVYLRMVDTKNVEWRHRAQFFAIAAQMMRRILVDAARSRHSSKRGGGMQRVNLDEIPLITPEPDRCILDLDEALATFSKVAPRQAKVVELRYFAGLGEEEIAEVLEISSRTVRRDWDLARAWLLRELSAETGKSPTEKP